MYIEEFSLLSLSLSLCLQSLAKARIQYVLQFSLEKKISKSLLVKNSYTEVYVKAGFMQYKGTKKSSTLLVSRFRWVVYFRSQIAEGVLLSSKFGSSRFMDTKELVVFNLDLPPGTM